jgi:hypothetical protein
MGRTASLSRLPASVLEAELRRRQRSVGTLERRRNRLASKLDALDRQIDLLGGNGASRRGGARARNKMTLNEALVGVIKGRPLSVTEAAEAVQRAGYRTNSSNFRTQVNIALIKGGFKRVGRGRYVAK